MKASSYGQQTESLFRLTPIVPALKVSESSELLLGEMVIEVRDGGAYFRISSVDSEYKMAGPRCMLKTMSLRFSKITFLHDETSGVRLATFHIQTFQRNQHKSLRICSSNPQFSP